MDPEQELKSRKFKESHWDRATEFAPFLLVEDRSTAASIATLRRHRLALDFPKQTSSVHISLDWVDSAAKRFALWNTRKTFDWFHTEVVGALSERDRLLHDQITSGIWQLDVDGLRSIGQALLASDSLRLGELRTELSGQAGELGASLDMGLAESDNRFAVHEWRLIRDSYDEACDSVDHFLRLGNA